MANEQPLYLRLYSQPHLIALARLVGYQGLPDPQFWEHYRTLCSTFGQDKMSAGKDEIIAIDTTATPAIARLKPEVRKLCWQLLGPPPEEHARFYGTDAPAPAKPARSKKR